MATLVLMSPIYDLLEISGFEACLRSRGASSLDTHFPNLATHTPNLTTHPPT
jgi:hypothetical protein